MESISSGSSGTIKEIAETLPFVRQRQAHTHMSKHWWYLPPLLLLPPLLYYFSWQASVPRHIPSQNRQPLDIVISAMKGLRSVIAHYAYVTTRYSSFLCSSSPLFVFFSHKYSELEAGIIPSFHASHEIFRCFRLSPTLHPYTITINSFVFKYLRKSVSLWRNSMKPASSP